MNLRPTIDEMRGRQREAVDMLPEPFRGLDEPDMDELLEILAEPMRSLHKIIGKEQMRRLCIQLLAKNAVLQKKIDALEAKKP